MNISVFVKTMKNVRKQRNIKFEATERREDYLVCEPNYHTTEFFAEDILPLNTYE